MSADVRIGLLRLSDAAPVIAAAEWGLFTRHGVRAALSVEPSWANVADKLAYGLLDAAVILPPLAIAASLGLRGPRTELIVPMGLSLGGNTVALSAAAADDVAARRAAGDILARGRAFAGWLRARYEAGVRARLGVVHLFSGHNLLLRYWLAACGADPDAAFDTVVLPPADMPAALAAGQIDGFCAGAPWGPLAARQGIGRVIAGSDEIWRDHPEKMLAVRRGWALEDPARLSALLSALLAAGRLCDDPRQAEALAGLLAEPRHVGAPAAAIRLSLAGGGPDDGGRIRFGDAASPRPEHAAWFAGQMQRWGWFREQVVAEAAALYRPDLAPGGTVPERSERFCDRP